MTTEQAEQLQYIYEGALGHYEPKTISKTMNCSKGKYTCTFPELTKIYGIKQLQSYGSWELAICTSANERTPITISGNSVTFQLDDIYDDNSSPTKTFTITVVGI